MLKNSISFMLILVFIFKVTTGFPIGPRDGIEIPPPEVLKFMRRFGYLDQNPDDSEALYHESAIVEAIKNIQKYGALNQTGRLDAMTLELLTKPRCGVPDIEGKPYYLRQEPIIAKTASPKLRKKRFIFGAKTWTKRNIKYLIGNWSLKIPREQIERDIGRALNVWSQYSNLKFHRVEDTSADIIVGFGTQYHGDNYPFDGAGNILAHAFYPYEMGSWGGDVHFDEDENWKENSTDLTQGVDFYTVALHELGHSLGLAHSPVYSSVMFPYYKGPEHNVLDYDDTLAMYNAYLNKKLDDDVDSIDRNDDYDTLDSSTEQEDTTEYNTSPSNWNVDKNEKFPEYSTTAMDHNVEQSYLSPIPNICEGKFDAVCYFNNSMHIFKGEYIWQVSHNYRVVLGYPKKFRDLFQVLPENIKNIDACYERFDKVLVLFSGTQIWFYEEQKLLENNNVTLQDYLGNAMDKKRINAALLWPKNNRTYIFADTIFWRFNDELKSLDEGYPKAMHRWPGIPDNIDAAATLPNGKTYFFKDNRYWLYNNVRVQPERGYPRRASAAWLSCTRRTTQIPFRSNDTTVSFISVSAATSASLPNSSSPCRSAAPSQTQTSF